MARMNWTSGWDAENASEPMDPMNPMAMPDPTERANVSGPDDRQVMMKPFQQTRSRKQNNAKTASLKKGFGRKKKILED